MCDKNIFVHKSSFVNDNANIGSGTRVWQFCTIMGEVEIGKDCNIGQNVFIENKVVIGNNVTIKNNISLYTGVVCEDDVFLGPNVVFTNVINPRSFVSRKDEFKNTIVKKGASIGANATIICGVTIGEYAMIGAGSVVTKDVPKHALVYGNPARFKGYVCECGEKLSKKNFEYYCFNCNKYYDMY